jgi:hypothetical protein
VGVAAERLFECSFLIPLRRDSILSDGRPHRRKTWAWLDGELSAFGGGSRAPEPYEGWYRDRETGERVNDRSRKYFVAVSRAQLEELRGLLRQACVEFQQKTIYLSVAGRVEFVEAEGDGST